MIEQEVTQKVCNMIAGCTVDMDALDDWGIDDLHILKKISDQYHMGWLHNVMARITPLTLDRLDEYLLMADLFVSTKEEASHVLDRFDSDLELFCSVAGVKVTKHMTAATVSEELEAHVSLYMEIEKIFANKFKFMELRDPIKQITNTPITEEYSNEFIKNFMDVKFNRV
ncbi:MAG TPA: hypothetical protein DCL21_06655 [Alphaproteobacteria bacterium]|nr:hypothetical protein [Alphaproteobacteria bacterium]